MLRRLLRDLTNRNYLLMLAASICGVFGVAWWTAVPLGAAGLLLSGWPKYAALLPRVKAVGAEWEFFKTLALSTGNALIAIGAAFVLGRVIGWLWGPMA